eukprot:scaffold72537_cov57-Phaeocystis_antarctica.AAC.4
MADVFGAVRVRVRVRVRGQSGLARSSPVRPPTAPEGSPPAGSGLPSGPERRALASWVTERGPLRRSGAPLPNVAHSAAFDHPGVDIHPGCLTLTLMVWI